jgi:4-hydroxy-4-methyl-2-oxoglutarate aldolase
VKQRQGLFMDAIAVCDDSGVVIVPKELHHQEFMERLEWIEKQEDIWYKCIDQKKWSTFETVCMKRYMHET